MKRDLLTMLGLGAAITAVMAFLTFVMGGEEYGLPLATGISITIIGVVLILIAYSIKNILKSFNDER